MIKEFFAYCEARFPEQRAQLRQISLALRREQINSMEQLCRLCRDDPGTLTAIRAIGAKRLELIRQVCTQYEHRSCQAAPNQQRQEGVL